MSILESFCMPVKQQSNFHIVGEDQASNKNNLFIAKNEKNDCFFLIMVKFCNLKEENCRFINLFYSLQNSFFVRLDSLFYSNPDSIYFVFEFQEMTLKRFLEEKSGTTDFKDKLLLAKKFIDIVIFTAMNHLYYSDYDPNLIFIDRSNSELTPKLFYNGKIFLIQRTCLKIRHTTANEQNTSLTNSL